MDRITITKDEFNAAVAHCLELFQEAYHEKDKSGEFEELYGTLQLAISGWCLGLRTHLFKED